MVNVTYAEGSISIASTTKGDDFRNAIVTAATGVSGWTVLDHGYSNSGNKRSVLKCNKTVSGLSEDFYVLIWNETNGNPIIGLVESYDEATHTASYPLVFDSPTDALGRWNLSKTTLSVGAPGSYSNRPDEIGGFHLSLSVGQYFSVMFYDDGVAFTSQAGQSFYAGAFNSLVTNPTVNDPLPICFAVNPITSGVSGTVRGGHTESNVFFTRFAMGYNLGASVPGSSYGINRVFKAACAIPLIPTLHQVAPAPTYLGVDPYTNKEGLIVSPYLYVNTSFGYQSALSGNKVFQGISSQYGIFRGTSKYLISNFSSNWGDTLTVGNEVYQSCGSFNGYAVLKEVLN